MKLRLLLSLSILILNMDNQAIASQIQDNVSEAMIKNSKIKRNIQVKSNKLRSTRFPKAKARKAIHPLLRKNISARSHLNVKRKILESVPEMQKIRLSRRLTSRKKLNTKKSLLAKTNLKHNISRSSINHLKLARAKADSFNKDKIIPNKGSPSRLDAIDENKTNINKDSSSKLDVIDKNKPILNKDSSSKLDVIDKNKPILNKDSSSKLDVINENKPILNKVSSTESNSFDPNWKKTYKLKNDFFVERTPEHIQLGFMRPEGNIIRLSYGGDMIQKECINDVKFDLELKMSMSQKEFEKELRRTSLI